ncbi:hypothetical protein [Erwinia psidii]|uniref:Uncharacterized protein n=1 Tax=Erwinia psidii TaxID=69224 RepID=A0A3N6S944_9GAMM|nr:hypothetical protein [Erwinia psidii]MCX8959481.1 hypothetical protein [Erwinia psidii]MCX8961873.1 hypothetical protein [Erwinia psidii]MCX8966549.1 hypothetical protein [Erwinia psidii]RQM37730.1 hypothetical protein EB241_12760 [Erwinia psidii]
MEKHGTDENKALKQTQRLQRWLYIGGAVVGAQAIMHALSPSPTWGYLAFEVLLAVGCTSYALWLSSKTNALRKDNAGNR